MSGWQQLPPAFLERLPHVVGEAAFPAVANSFCVKRPTTLRANTLKISPSELLSQLQVDGFELEPVSWYESAFILKNQSLKALTEHPLYTQGALYVQSLSSMIPPLVLDPQPGERILDLAAAPGSKTTQMAMMMNNQGEILANDLSTIRLYKLQANLKMQGVEIVNTRRGRGEEVWQHWPESFDRALVDVPCSMEGRFQCDDPKTWENWSPKKVKELGIRQRALLRSAVSATKPGGVIVYSTCTLSPEENEMVIDWLLKKEGGRVVVEEISIAGLELAPAMTGWKHKQFHEQLTLTRRILPSPHMEGFFVAKLRKTHSTLLVP
ncbi:MAG TPA: RsmB/NOP family class I SAM-dependent RNA methyltransferase [Vitreimonas sp.]|nr:RsmB/NOP family class I SAM-dependent RNA methyltransferase [Vitreimonas sp.]